MQDERLITLESKLAYQEDHIQSLNDALFAMQKQIDQLELTCQRLKDKLADMQNHIPNEIISDQPPPHY